MKSYKHIKTFINKAERSKTFFDKDNNFNKVLDLDLTFETFLANWTMNYDIHTTDQNKLGDFDEDVMNGFYTRTTTNDIYAHYKFTEKAKDYLRFKHLL